MCGRFTITVTIGLPERFGVAHCKVPLLPRYNIAPSQPVPVITHPFGSIRECQEMTWGLIPSTSKDPTHSPRPINARAETLHERSTFRPLLSSRRCLIPATGFYEWVRSGKSSIPYYIHCKNGDLFALAGLWDAWKAPDGLFRKTFTIITTRPNPLVARYHDRMPAILLPENEARWLDFMTPSNKELKELLSPYPEEYLTAHRVSLAVNDPMHEDASLIKRDEGGVLPV
ncbi:MAG: SOS response-associated peptidase [Methanoregulaceae archaeon]|nr:SOS response-associated peptidase [Methanoregulaceae archaeon]